MVNLIENLRKFGLSEREAKVYLASLELSNALASDIALKGGLPRTLVYDILERLIEKGLISETNQNNKKYFRAAEPEKLIQILKDRESAVNEILSDLKQMGNAEAITKPRVILYQGIEGMKNYISDLSKTMEDILVLGDDGKVYENMPNFVLNWHKERVKKKSGLRVIFYDSKRIREILEGGDEIFKNMDYKFMKDGIDSSLVTTIYDNKISFQDWSSDPFVIILENESLANAFRKYFERIWNSIKNK